MYVISLSPPTCKPQVGSKSYRDSRVPWAGRVVGGGALFGSVAHSPPPTLSTYERRQRPSGPPTVLHTHTEHLTIYNCSKNSQTTPSDKAVDIPFRMSYVPRRDTLPGRAHCWVGAVHEVILMIYGSTVY